MYYIFNAKIVRFLPRVKERNKSKKNKLKRGVQTFHTLKTNVILWIIEMRNLELVVPYLFLVLSSRLS